VSASRPGTSRATAPRARPHPALAERRRAIARAQGRRRRSAVLVGVGALVVVAVLYWMATGPLVAVHGVSVSGYDRGDRAQLVAALSDAAAAGTVVSPATAAMDSAARDFPWVESISVTRRWPRALSVQVHEEVPAAVAAFEDQAVLVAQDGRVLAVKDGTRGLGWLRLDARPPPAGERLPDAARAGLAFIAAADPAVGARVRALHADRAGDLVGRITDGPELRLGAPERMGAKARSLGLLLANLSPEEEAAASYIDLSVPENPALGPPA
jgi:cell division septal protein FtsQ